MQLAGKKVYCPSAILGINSKSSKAEDAKKFVSYVLGEEGQSLNQGSGLEVYKRQLLYSRKTYAVKSQIYSGG